MPDALDELAAAGDPGPLDGLSIEELRHRRQDLQAAEHALSYVRRLVQGRLDIVLDERRHRADGSGARTVAERLADLPTILSDRVAGGGRGALPAVDLPALDLPGGDLDVIVAAVDRILDAGRLASLVDVPAPALAAIADELAAFEQRVSRHRRALHGAIDAVQGEIVRRYQSGAASVEALLR